MLFNFRRKAAQPGVDQLPEVNRLPSVDRLSNGLVAWADTDDFRSLCVRFRDSPDSLLSNESRALLYHLIVTRTPASVLEIGTYMAGTTRVIAESLHDAGSGHLHTLDPFGADRCPRIISQ